MGLFKIVSGAAAGALLLFVAGCEVPPMESEQNGFRGTGMAQINNPESDAIIGAIPVAGPLAPSSGPKAGALYENVQVLGDLSVAEFTRLMAAMTEWVAPEEGCNYCHVAGNLASDDIYTKVVSRRMLQMTQNVNVAYEAHVGETGVTCYTCHRGNNVPQYIWTLDDADPPTTRGMAGWNADQNRAGVKATAYSSLPYDPFRSYLENRVAEPGNVRVQATTALPAGTRPKNIKQTEQTYGLMMHWSDALGVNCTYCHNSRAFGSWEESTPVRVTAWHGLRMVQGVNEQYLAPLATALPEHRLGMNGDAPKANCATCHQGVNKPLGGAPMAKDYPSLRKEGKPDTNLRASVTTAIDAAEVATLAAGSGGQ